MLTVKNKIILSSDHHVEKGNHTITIQLVDDFLISLQQKNL